MKANDAWLQTIGDVITNGEAVPPQKSTGSGGRLSFELLGHQLSFDMHYPLVTIKPTTSWLYMCAEPLWVIEGSNPLSWNSEIEHIQGPYSDDQIVLKGAYGPPFKQQIRYIIEKINEDRNTRQAVMTIWKRAPKPSKDIPCTVALQFIVRNDKLHCLVTMRSSDVGMGLPYDMFTFTCMTAEIASRLAESTDLGTCVITAGSRHIYQDQMHKLSHLYSNYVAKSADDYEPFEIWKWPAVKEAMYNIISMQYEDRSFAQSIARDRLMSAT